MASTSSIEWTESTWNPVTGCTKISSGCKHCYAARMAKRLKAMGVAAYKDEFSVRIHPEALDMPRRWCKPRTIFVNSMSDLFHKDVPLSFIRQIFTVMNECPQHIFQILTKRSGRARQLAPSLTWSPNIWMGVTVESGEYTSRLDDLREIPAQTRFVSAEPLIAPPGAWNLSNIDWLIAGGESGPGARPMKPEWARSLRDQCVEQNTRFFFKQWGGVNKKKAGRVLDGRTWDEIPELARRATG